MESAVFFAITVLILLFLGFWDVLATALNKIADVLREIRDQHKIT